MVKPDSAGFPFRLSDLFVVQSCLIAIVALVTVYIENPRSTTRRCPVGAVPTAILSFQTPFSTTNMSQVSRISTKSEMGDKGQ